MVSTKPKEKKMKEKKKATFLLPVCVYYRYQMKKEEEETMASRPTTPPRRGMVVVDSRRRLRRRLVVLFFLVLLRCFLCVVVFCVVAKSTPFSSMTMVLAKEIPVSNPIDVVGYLPDWRLNEDDDATRRRTRSLVHALCARTNALILFSIEVDKNGELDKLERLPSTQTRKEIQLAKERYGCEVYVTIGGSSRTNGFAEATSTKEMREKFASRVSRFLYEEYEEDVFDGVDLNWSYPRNETEWRNLGKFAKALKKDFREHDVTKKVSIAYYPNENQEQILEMLEVTEFADGVHAMAYDSDDRDGHSNMRRAMDALNFAQDSFTGGKIMRLGVPFYGRSIPESSRTAPEWMSYGDLMRDNKYELSDEIDAAKSKDGVEVWFNGKNLIREKVKMCRVFEDVCQGIFVWELGQDVSMNDIDDDDDDDDDEGGNSKMDFRTRRERGLLAALTRAAWGDKKYDEMLAKEIQFSKEDEKKKDEL